MGGPPSTAGPSVRTAVRMAGTDRPTRDRSPPTQARRMADWVELTPFPSKRHSGIARPMLGGFVYTTGEYSQETWLGLPGE